jgi:hypothetical protein
VTGAHDLHIVLDKSAVLDYLDGNVAVGEALTLLLDEVEPACFGVHLTTLAEADLAHEGEDLYQRTVTPLMAHVAFQPLTIDRDDMDELLEFARLLRSVEFAVALVAANKRDAVLLTRHTDLYVNPDGSQHERVVGI